MGMGALLAGLVGRTGEIENSRLDKEYNDQKLLRDMKFQIYTTAMEHASPGDRIKMIPLVDELLQPIGKQTGRSKKSSQGASHPITGAVHALSALDILGQQGQTKTPSGTTTGSDSSIPRVSESGTDTGQKTQAQAQVGIGPVPTMPMTPGRALASVPTTMELERSRRLQNIEIDQEAAQRFLSENLTFYEKKIKEIDGRADLKDDEKRTEKAIVAKQLGNVDTTKENPRATNEMEEYFRENPNATLNDYRKWQEIHPNAITALAYRRMGLQPDGSPIPETELTPMEKLKLTIEGNRASHKPLVEELKDAWLIENPGKTLVDFEKWHQRLKQQNPLMNQQQIDYWGAAALVNPQLLSLFGFGPQIRGPIAASAASQGMAGGITPGEVAAQPSIFKAESASLTDLQKMYDSTTAFAKMSKANWKQAADMLDKVPDLGAPLWNKPIRNLNAKAFGSADLPAFNAATKLASIDSARVITQARQQGVLSDNARQEIEQIAGANIDLTALTPKALREVIRIFQNDMDNRTKYLNEQIKTRKKSMQSRGRISPVPETETITEEDPLHLGL